MKLRSGTILGLITGLNVRVLRSGKVISTLPVKLTPKAEPTVHRAKCIVEASLDNRVELQVTEKPKLRRRKGKRLVTFSSDVRFRQRGLFKVRLLSWKERMAFYVIRPDMDLRGRKL